MKAKTPTFGLLVVMALLELASIGSLSTSGQSARATAVESRGAEAMVDFDRLPYFRRGTTIHQVSSFDRTGGNLDGSGYYLYQHPETGGYVVLEEAKPGTIYRIWATWRTGEGNGNIRIFFDNEGSPRVDVPIQQIFSGERVPFLSPLVGNDQTSPGAFFSYHPFAFREAVRVEFTTVPRYYQITYQLYSTADGVATYMGTEDLTAVYDAWNHPSVDPKDRTGNQSVYSGPFDLSPGQSKVLFDHTGAGSLRSLVLSLPQLVITQYAGNTRTVTDDGRYLTGRCSFSVAIEPANTGVTVTRRLDYGFRDQTADVYVDGQKVGRWSDRGSDYERRWRDSVFFVPGTFTEGKTQIAISVSVVASTWTEYYYWVETARPSGERAQTDSLDIGAQSSEDAHGYAVVGQTWEGTNTYTYPPIVPTRYDQTTLDILGLARVEMYWDGEATPSVDVPIGFLFGVGSSGEGLVQALLMGSHPLTHTFYNYFPMPFAQSASVRLVNKSPVTIQGASARLEYNNKPYTGLGTEAGYFTAKYNTERPLASGRDYPLLDIPSATGHVVAVIMCIREYETTLRILEGDERVFIDTREFNPVIHGTGTEDYFNGGWYFGGSKIFTLPVHGVPLFHRLDGKGHLAMYRLSLADAYPFERQFRFNFEHGSTNNVNAWYETVAFAYVVKWRESLVQSDALDVGNAVDEARHQYVINGQTWEGSLPWRATFLGRDNVSSYSYSGTGRAHRGSSAFTVSVSASNQGVRLARILDHGSANQRASVYVDGVLAGTWYTGGSNASNRALYDCFEIPPDLTASKSSIRVSIEFVGGDLGWNEFYYYVYCHEYPSTATPTSTLTPTASPTPTSTLSSMPSPTRADTPTPSPVPTDTATLVPSATDTSTPTNTVVATPSLTSLPTDTPGATATASPTRHWCHLPAVLRGEGIR
jgi:hypothetical protein